MDQVVQTNAAQTEELSSTAQSLAGQADRLQSLVSRFKLGSELELEAIAESPRRRAADVRPGRRRPHAVASGQGRRHLTARAGRRPRAR